MPAPRAESYDFSRIRMNLASSRYHTDVEFSRIDVNANDAFGFSLPTSHDSTEADGAQSEDGNCRSLFHLGLVEGCAIPGGDTTRQQANPIQADRVIHLH